MSPDFRPSKKTDAISAQIKTAIGKDLSDFRRNPAIQKLSQWDTKAFGGLYFKMLLCNEANRLTPHQLRLLDAVDNRSFGDPISIRIHGDREIDYNYLSAVLEVDFIGDILGDVRVVSEIGAGFGRTCHAILCNFPEIASYRIIDVETSIELSRAYLGHVLPAQLFSKIEFVDARRDEDTINRSDIFLAIDSMMEMEESVVDSYLRHIALSSKYFYVKDPIAKYLPEEIGLEGLDPEVVGRAMAVGKIRNAIRIFSSSEYGAQIPRFLEAFRPSVEFEPTRHAVCAPAPIYYQALYVGRF